MPMEVLSDTAGYYCRFLRDFAICRVIYRKISKKACCEVADDFEVVDDSGISFENFTLVRGDMLFVSAVSCIRSGKHRIAF